MSLPDNLSIWRRRQDELAREVTMGVESIPGASDRALSEHDPYLVGGTVTLDDVSFSTTERGLLR